LDIGARLKSLPTVAEVPQGLGAKTKGLKRRLRAMGPVNLEAPAEYQQVLERHSFLMGQVEDLEAATKSLRKVVAELDRLMEDKFLETFNAVAAEFEAYFPRLFNGGKGKLVLTNPENPLQSGVEIVAQPPGRRRGSIDLLSGGERSLTSVALTFAILKACDTPFCLLDEVDARLDEVNIGRFSQALKELAERTQIIIITHNRITLESADAIYGITLAGDSTSRVLSLRPDEVQAKAS
jgi:chromosome segregation protein